MKRVLCFISYAVIFTAIILLNSCSSDDDDNGTASSSAGVLDKETGLRVKSFGDNTIYYSENGRIDYIRHGSYTRYEFSYNPNKIIEMYNGDEEESHTVSYNGYGYLSSASYNYSNHDDDDKWTESGSTSLSYDGSGHLVKINGSYKWNGTEDGERYSGNGSSNYVLTWKNNQLLKVAINWKEIEDGETETETETWTFSYDNDNNENQYCQWAPSIGYFLDSSLEECLAYVGLLGKGPSILPSSGEMEEEEYYDGKNHTYNNSYTYRYGFNTNGSISYTTINGSRTNFSYDYADVDNHNTHLVKEQKKESEDNQARKLIRLFMRSHKLSRHQ